MDTVVNLRVLEGVLQLLCNIRWENLFNPLAKTYELPTREFLASSRQDSKDATVIFQLLGESHLLNFERVNEIMGTQMTGTHMTSDKMFQRV